jgi:hypothetical protein
MGEMRNVRNILFGNLKGKDHSEDIGIDGSIILKWVLGKYGGNLWTGCI